jgi:hypothetical protein
MRRRLTAWLVLPALALGACGTNDVDTASYTCGQFSKSLRTKDDDSAGNYINQLRKQARLGQNAKTERNEITFGILVACRGKPPSTKPAKQAIATAKRLKAGKKSSH